MLKTRIITALALAGLGVLLLSVAPAFSSLGFAVIILFCAWEWSRLLQGEKWVTPVFVGLVAILLASLLYMQQADSSYQSVTIYWALTSGSAFWGIVLLWIISYPASAVIWGNKRAQFVLGLFVLGTAFVALIYLRYLEDSEWFFVYLLFIVAGTDVGAYFFGKTFGKRKLAVKVSPGKTWEGFFGGILLMSLLTILLVTQFGIPGLSLIQALVLAWLTASVSVLGDLFESMLKRQAGVKDSSQLLPGHGGFLDRFDSVLAALPVYALGLVSILGTS